LKQADSPGLIWSYPVKRSKSSNWVWVAPPGWARDVDRNQPVGLQAERLQIETLLAAKA
jgi:hypothetical protein